jgi:hypothetical protein
MWSVNENASYGTLIHAEFMRNYVKQGPLLGRISAEDILARMGGDLIHIRQNWRRCNRFQNGCVSRWISEKLRAKKFQMTLRTYPDHRPCKHSGSRACTPTGITTESRALKRPLQKLATPELQHFSKGHADPVGGMLIPWTLTWSILAKF